MTRPRPKHNQTGGLVAALSRNDIQEAAAIYLELVMAARRGNHHALLRLTEATASISTAQYIDGQWASEMIEGIAPFADRSPEVRHALIEIIRRGDYQHRLEAANVLRPYAHYPDVLPVFASLLLDENIEDVVKDKAAAALRRLVVRDKKAEVADLLAEAVTNRAVTQSLPVMLQANIIEALHPFVVNNKRLHEVLVAYLDSNSPQALKFAAILALAPLATQKADVRQRLLDIARTDKNASVRAKAIQAIGAFAAQDPGTIGLLRSIVLPSGGDAPDDDVRTAAIQALSLAATSSEASRDVLLLVLQSDDVPMPLRIEAAKKLERVAATDETARHALMQSARASVDDQLRVASLQSLSALAPTHADVRDLCLSAETMSDLAMLDAVASCVIRLMEHRQIDNKSIALLCMRVCGDVRRPDHIKARLIASASRWLPHMPSDQRREVLDLLHQQTGADTIREVDLAILQASEYDSHAADLATERLQTENMAWHAFFTQPSVFAAIGRLACKRPQVQRVLVDAIQSNAPAHRTKATGAILALAYCPKDTETHHALFHRLLDNLAAPEMQSKSPTALTVFLLAQSKARQGGAATAPC